MTDVTYYHIQRERFSFFFASSYELCYVNGEGWHFDGRESRESARWFEWHKGATRHPRGACGNAAWRLHYFWGEKCPFLLEDSSPRATRETVLLKFSELHISAGPSAHLLPSLLSVSLSHSFSLSLSLSLSLFFTSSRFFLFLPSSRPSTPSYLQPRRFFKKKLRNRRHNPRICMMRA